MSLFNWLTRDRSAKAPADTSGVDRTEPQRPASAAAGSGQRKSERMARRELLYSVVRESMARAGVLSASYKFKVLSLDAAGRQFLVMVDLAASERADAELLADIEAVIAQRAKSRHDLVVSAVYWRRNDQVGVGAARIAPPRQLARTLPGGEPSQPAELVSQPMPLGTGGPARPSAPGSAFDPIQDDEMEAFRAALANGLGGDAAAAPPSARTGRRGSAPEAGFPDTELREEDPRTRTLSQTQSGDLQ